MPQNVGTFLDDQIDVSQGHVLNFGFRRQECHQGRGQFFGHVSHEIRVLRHHLHVLHQNFDGTQNDGSIGMCQSWRNSLANGLGFTFIFGSVVGQ